MIPCENKENMDSDYSSDSNDTDTELQKAFERKELKPGLNAYVPYIKKEHVCNVAGMKQKLKEFRLDLDWVERLDMTNEPAPPSQEMIAHYGDLELKLSKKGKVIQEDDVNNDFIREMTFYRQAQAAVLEGIPRLKALGISTKRPEDYFAQMAKTDDHMKRVREKLLEKQKSLELSEKAKKLRELKKFGKKIQQEVQQQRRKEKKKMLESVKKLKKGKILSEELLEEMPAMDKKSKKTPKNVKTKKKKMTKREYKDSIYGFGGQKKRSKYNTAESAADVSGYSGRFSQPPGKKLKGNKRPGKAKRQKLKNRRRKQH